MFTQREYGYMLTAAKSILGPEGLDSRDQAAAIADLDNPGSTDIESVSDAELFIHDAILTGELSAWL